MTQAIEQPVPQRLYLPAVRNGDLINTSGMTPRKAWVLIYSGEIGVDAPVENHRDAVRLATSNALTAAKTCLKEGEEIALTLQLNVYLNTEPEFTSHPKIADFASEFLIEQLGEGCIGSRAAIGVASLPSDEPVEISMIAKVG